jgi:hypothetical protein
MTTETLTEPAVSPVVEIYQPPFRLLNKGGGRGGQARVLEYDDDVAVFGADGRPATRRIMFRLAEGNRPFAQIVELLELVETLRSDPQALQERVVTLEAAIRDGKKSLAASEKRTATAREAKDAAEARLVGIQEVLAEAVKKHEAFAKQAGAAADAKHLELLNQHAKLSEQNEKLINENNRLAKALAAMEQKELKAAERNKK